MIKCWCWLKFHIFAKEISYTAVHWWDGHFSNYIAVTEHMFYFLFYMGLAIKLEKLNHFQRRPFLALMHIPFWPLKEEAKLFVLLIYAMKERNCPLCNYFMDSQQIFNQKFIIFHAVDLLLKINWQSQCNCNILIELPKQIILPKTS